MELGYLHYKFLGQPILDKEELDANLKRIEPGFMRRNSRVGFLSFNAVDAVWWWVP